MDKFINRADAGKKLATKLLAYAKRPDVIVLALPRGGVPVAFEVATSLHVPLDVFIVRKLGVPGYEELAMGAIAGDDIIVFNEDVLREISVAKEVIDQVIKVEQEELKRRENKYRNNRPLPNLTHKTIILVDDGIATGATMRAAIDALRQKNPAKIIVAVPVAAADTCKEMQKLVDEMICLLQPEFFCAVGAWYENFKQTTDDEVFNLLRSTPQDQNK